MFMTSTNTNTWWLAVPFNTASFSFPHSFRHLSEICEQFWNQVVQRPLKKFLLLLSNPSPLRAFRDHLGSGKGGWRWGSSTNANVHMSITKEFSWVWWKIYIQLRSKICYNLPTFFLIIASKKSNSSIATYMRQGSSKPTLNAWKYSSNRMKRDGWRRESGLMLHSENSADETYQCFISYLYSIT